MIFPIPLRTRIILHNVAYIIIIIIITILYSFIGLYTVIRQLRGVFIISIHNL